MTKEQKVALGIDLGTTTTCVGFVKENGEVEIIPTEFGSNTMQSIVFIDTEGKEQMLVGEAALNQASKSPKDTFYEVKRLMGHTFAEVKHLASKLVFEISEGPNGLCYVKATNGKLYSPVEISAGILRKVAQQAESFLGYKADKVVITVPAYFDDKQRRATEEAGKLAGLTVCRIINEPTAAGIAYGLDKQKTGLSAVFDLGGGTFDISIIETMVTKGEGQEKDQIDLRIIGTDGNALVGGSNIDELIMEYMRKEAQNQGLTFDNTPYNFYRLKEAAKSAKQYLSKLNSYDIQIVGFTKDGKTFRHTLTRMKLDELAAPIVKQCMEVCDRCLKTIKLTTKDIERVILVGGMTRMPLVQAKVAEFFSKKPETAGNPDETVAIGAARSASMFSDYSSVGANVTIIDVTPLTLGIETLGGVFTKLIEKNTAIPTRKTQVFSTAEDNQSIVSIRVFQGERAMANDNKLIGSFDLSGISPQQRGIPQIEVTFEVDTNGLLTVSAKDRGSGKEQKISVKDTSKLSRQEIEEMERRAAQFKEEDEKRVAIIQAKNELSATASTCRSTLDKREKISAELANQLEEAIRKAQDMVAKEDKDLSIEEIHSLNTEISSLISRAGDEISKAEASAK